MLLVDICWAKWWCYGRITCNLNASPHGLNRLGMTSLYPTFADAFALVRQRLWQNQTFQTLLSKTDMVKVPRSLFNTWSDLLCYAA